MAHSPEAVWKGFKDEKKNFLTTYVFINKITIWVMFQYEQMFLLMQTHSQVKKSSFTLQTMVTDLCSLILLFINRSCLCPDALIHQILPLRILPEAGMYSLWSHKP